MTTPLQQIIAKLPQLSPADRTRLRAALDFVDGRKSARAPERFVRSTDDWVLPGIERELRRRGLFTGKLLPDRVNRAAPNYQEDAAAFCQHYRRRIKKVYPELKHAQLVALGIIFARALADYLPSVLHPNASLGLQTMLRNVNKMPDAIEASFPGYLQAGMLLFLLNT